MYHISVNKTINLTIHLLPDQQTWFIGLLLISLILLLGITLWFTRQHYQQTNKTLQAKLVHCQSQLNVEMAERKWLEANLEESETRYTHAELLGGFGQWEQDLIENSFSWSKGLYHILGFEPGQIEPSYKNFLQLVDPADKPRWQQTLEKALTTDNYFDISLCLNRPQNDQRTIRVLAKIAVDQAGRPTRIVGVVKDITEQTQWEKNIRTTETKFRDFVEKTDDLVTQVDGEGTITYVNRQAGKFFGLPVAACIGQSAYSFIHPNDRARTEQSVAEWIAEQRFSVTFENRLLSRTGQSYDMLWTINLNYGNSGQVTTINCIARDITNYKWLTEQLRYQANILSQVSNAVIGTDLNYRIQSWNQAATNLYGWREEEVIGKLVSEVLMTEFIDVSLEEVVQEFLAQGFWKGEVIQRHKDGSKVNILATVSIVTNEAGTPTGVVAIHHDITARKQIEQELQQHRDDLEKLVAQRTEQLRQSEAKQRAQYKGIPVPTYSWQHKNNTFVLIDYNDAAEKITRGKIVNLLGSDISTLYAPDSPILVDMEQCLITQTPIEREMPYTFKTTHEQKYLLVKYAFVPPDLVLVHTDDITVRKQAEQVLQKAKETAEAASQAKTTFLATMSHELRTPLNAIIGFSQLMVHSENLSSEQRSHLDIIIRNGDHLLTLINQVLDLSKIETGYMSLNLEIFDLHRLLDELADMFRLRIKAKKLRFFFRRTEDVPHYIQTDQVKLRQVLINLLNNALKFTQQGGIAWRIHQSAVKEETIKHWLHVIIEDTGPGIPLEEQQYLFEAFFQTSTGQRLQEGTGLGLSISRKFVQLMGGEMTVHSPIRLSPLKEQVGGGPGSRFEFYIQSHPIETAELPALKIERRVIGLQPNQPTYRLLVVDDNADNRQLFISLLTPLGFEVQEAENGQQAIEIWQRWQPHLIWMDLRMPGMDGYEATRTIKLKIQKQPRSPNLQPIIIAMTASTLEGKRAVMTSTGCDDFLQKPFREYNIFNLLHKHIGVQFIYDESLYPEVKDEQPVNLETLAPRIQKLPATLVGQLEQATRHGNITILESLIKEIEAYDTTLASTLRQLTDDFEYAKILTLIQTTTFQ